MELIDLSNDLILLYEFDLGNKTIIEKDKVYLIKKDDNSIYIFEVEYIIKQALLSNVTKSLKNSYSIGYFRASKLDEDKILYRRSKLISFGNEEYVLNDY